MLQIKFLDSLNGPPSVACFQCVIITNMLLHPAFVHFPIALLTLYAVCELVWIKRLRQNISWFWFKLGLLFFGALSSIVTYQTGKMAAQVLGGSRLVYLHGSFALATVWYFCILAFFYLVDAVIRGVFPTSLNLKITAFIEKYSLVRKVWEIILTFKDFIMDSGFLWTFALIGLALVTITGALGGAIAFGPDVDPMVRIVYNLFF